MKPVLLIAVNFAREQRWPILTLLLWVLLLAFLGLVTDIHRQREDLLFVFKQDAVYVLAFSVFFGGSAIYNERRSRRILGVLSKAVGRQQYLSGLCARRDHCVRCLLLYPGLDWKLDIRRRGISYFSCLVPYGLPGGCLHVGRHRCFDVFYFLEPVLCSWRYRHGFGRAGAGRPNLRRTMGLCDTGVGARSDRPQFFFQLAGKSFLGSCFIGGSGDAGVLAAVSPHFCARGYCGRRRVSDSEPISEPTRLRFAPRNRVRVREGHPDKLSPPR